MFCAHKNSYLQLECAVNPRVINKAVSRAMLKKWAGPHDEIPAAQRLESMQPSLYGPCVDVSRARLGFGRIGLRMINNQLNDEDSFIHLQALHSMLDQVHTSENALFLIDMNVVYRLIVLMEDKDPIAREKVLLILIVLAEYYQGKKRIISRPIFIDRLIYMFMRDRKEIRYAAALFLKNLTKDRCCCEVIMKNNKIIESLLKMIKNDHTGIVILHLNSLKNLSEWDPVKALKLNAFQLLKSLIKCQDYRIVQATMDCMVQLCKHNVGKRLADLNDMTKYLLPYLVSSDIEVIISTLGLMLYTTLTAKSRWRAKHYIYELANRLVTLSTAHNIPVLQMRAMQVLINLCDCHDLRKHIRAYYYKKVKNKIVIRTHEQWDGTSETTSYGLETGHNYRTMCIEGLETIKNDKGDNDLVLNVHSYIGHVQKVKQQLLEAMKVKPCLE